MKQFALATALFLAGCATAASSGIQRVTPSQLAADPAGWDGKEVEVSGLMTWEFENLGLYDSRDAYCERAENSAIAVDWDEWAGVTRADNRRLVTVRGTFRNTYWMSGPKPKKIVISTGAPGPGPLEPGSVVRWDSPPLPACD